MFDHLGSLKWMKFGSVLMYLFTRGFTSCCWTQSTYNREHIVLMRRCCRIEVVSRTNKNLLQLF